MGIQDSTEPCFCVNYSKSLEKKDYMVDGYEHGRTATRTYNIWINETNTYKIYNYIYVNYDNTWIVCDSKGTMQNVL